MNQDLLLVNCPHCQQLIHVEQVNCAIFRCGVDKMSGQQIPPHLPKPECDRLACENRIYGCGKPFRVEKKEDSIVAVICDYI